MSFCIHYFLNFLREVFVYIFNCVEKMTLISNKIMFIVIFREKFNGKKTNRKIFSHFLSTKKIGE